MKIVISAIKKLCKKTNKKSGVNPFFLMFKGGI